MQHLRNSLALVAVLLAGCSNPKPLIIDSQTVKSVTCIYSIEWDNGAEKVGSFPCPPCQADDTAACFQGLPPVDSPRYGPAMLNGEQVGIYDKELGKIGFFLGSGSSLPDALTR